MSDPVHHILGRLRRRCPATASLRIKDRRSRAWRSLLFDGARHHVLIALSGAEIDDAIDTMRGTADEPAMDVPGHLVAEIRLSVVDRNQDTATLALDALTVEVAD